jgi:iron complex outermembrane receptor protein
VNGQYLKATTTTNLQVGNDYLPTAGKVGVQAPEYTATLGLNYAHGPFFGNLLFRYTGSQYSTFMNDEQMPAYSTIDMGLGYHIPAGIVGKDPIIRLSVTNLGNKPYLSTFASVQSNAVTTQGIDGTTITGKPGTYWLGSPMAIMGTISTSF